MSRLPLPERTRTAPDIPPFAGLVVPPERVPDRLAAQVPSRRVDLVWTDEVTGERLEIEVIADPGLIERLRQEGFQERGGEALSGVLPSPGDGTSPDDETAAA